MSRTSSTLPASVQRFDAGREMQVDAVIRVPVAVDGADLGAEHPLQGHRAGVDHGDVAAELAGGGRDLGADPAGPDHDDVGRVVQRGRQTVGVGEAAQVLHPVEVRTREAEAARGGAGRQQQAVVSHDVAALERDGVLVGVERYRGRVGAELDVLVGVEARVVDEDLVAVALAAQVVLGQRGPFVGAFGLLADEHDAPIEAVGAQGLGGLGAGEAGADDDNGVGCGHGSSLVGSGGGRMAGGAVWVPGRLCTRARRSGASPSACGDGVTGSARGPARTVRRSRASSWWQRGHAR